MHDIFACSLSRAHALHETIVDVNEILSPWEAHELEDLEELGEMQVLLGGNDVNHFVELVLFVPLDSTADIMGKVDGSSVWTRHADHKYRWKGGNRMTYPSFEQQPFQVSTFPIPLTWRHSNQR